MGEPMFDPVLLKTFVAVAETLSFTRAAQQLGLSQPTVSQHIRKLELAAGRNLVTRDTRDVRLTDNGDALLGFARSILAAHNDAMSYFTGSAMRGRLRFGSADDLALTQLPKILRDFRALYPHINLELTVNQSGALLRRLHAGQLDLVFIKQESGETMGRLVRRDRMVWVGHKSVARDPGDPLPLIHVSGAKPQQNLRYPRARVRWKNLAHHLQCEGGQRHSRCGPRGHRNRGVPTVANP